VVDLKEWEVDLSQAEVPAGVVKFTVANDGQFTHNAVVTGPEGQLGRTPNFAAAEGPQTFEVDLKPGEYTVLCDIPGHPEQGMKTTLVVK
jgi:plastocyanin